ASSSSMSFAYISSLARIFLAFTNICFSPVERPFSLSRNERFRTTSASSRMSPVFILSRLCLKRRFQFFGICVPPPVKALTTTLTMSSPITLRRPTFSAFSEGTLTVMSLCRILIVRYSRFSPSTSRDSFFTTVPAPWCGYTTLSPTLDNPTSQSRPITRQPDRGGRDRRRTRTSIAKDGRKSDSFQGFCGKSLLATGFERHSDRLTERLPRLGLETPALLRRRRNDGRRQSELRALLEPPLGLRRRPEAPGQPDLSEGCRPGRNRRASGCGGNGERPREVGARLVHPHASRDVDEHVGLSERDAAVAREDCDDHREPLRIDTRPDPPGHRQIRRRDKSLNLEQQRPRALERTRDGRSNLLFPGGPEDLRWVRHALEPSAGHLEDAQLVRRAEAVLDGTQDAMRVVAIALELEHAVDQVLEDARAGDGAVLGDVTDEK